MIGRIVDCDAQYGEGRHVRLVVIIVILVIAPRAVRTLV